MAAQASNAPRARSEAAEKTVKFRARADRTGIVSVQPIVLTPILQSFVQASPVKSP